MAVEFSGEYLGGLGVELESRSLWREDPNRRTR